MRGGGRTADIVPAGHATFERHPVPAGCPVPPGGGGRRVRPDGGSAVMTSGELAVVNRGDARGPGPGRRRPLTRASPDEGRTASTARHLAPPSPCASPSSAIQGWGPGSAATADLGATGQDVAAAVAEVSCAGPTSTTRFEPRWHPSDRPDRSRGTVVPESCTCRTSTFRERPVRRRNACDAKPTR